MCRSGRIDNCKFPHVRPRQLIITGIFFFILGVAGTVYLKRPKLRVVGGAGGGSGAPAGFQINHVTVRNIPGRLGITIGQTELLGLRINGRHKLGLPVMREPAKGCTAWLYDDSGNPITALWRRDPDEHGKRKVTIDIDSAVTAELSLFAERNDDIPNYYPYQPDANGDPVVPPIKFNGTRRFIVRIAYSDGEQKRDHKYTVSNDYQNGHLRIREGWGKHPVRRRMKLDPRSQPSRESGHLPYRWPQKQQNAGKVIRRCRARTRRRSVRLGRVGRTRSRTRSP